MYFQITWPRLWHENNIKREEENLHNGFGQLNIDKQKTFLCLRKPICRNRALNFKQRKYSVITTFARYSNTVIQFLKHITFTSHQMKSRIIRSCHWSTTKFSKRTESQWWNSRMTKIWKITKVMNVVWFAFLESWHFQSFILEHSECLLIYD